MNRNPRVERNEPNNQITGHWFAAFGKLGLQITDTVDTHFISGASRRVFLDLFKRIFLFRLSLQVTDNLCRRDQPTSDIGKKLVSFLAFEMQN